MTGDALKTFPDPETLAICEQFSLWLRQGGGLSVRARPLPRGDATGLDFEGFAEYAPGMDLRHLDWSIYARTRTFCVRTYADEGTGVLAVLLDGSGSMAVGEPSKWELARRLAAALVFAGLREVSEVLIGVMHGTKLDALPLTGGLSFAASAFRFLGDQRPGGTTDLAAALGKMPTGFARGDAVVISDFLDPRGPAGGLEVLAREGWRVDLVRISAPGEFALPPPGAAVHDPEGEGHVPMPKESGRRGRLQQSIAMHRAEAEDAALRWGALLLDFESAESLSGVLTRFFATVAARAAGGRSAPAPAVDG